MHNEIIVDNNYNMSYVSSFNEIETNEIENNIQQHIMKLEELYEQIKDEFNNCKNILYNNEDKILKITKFHKKHIYNYQIIMIFVFILFVLNIEITFIENKRVLKLNKKNNSPLIHGLYHNITNLENNYEQFNKNNLQPLYISSLYNKIINIEQSHEQLLQHQIKFNKISNNKLQQLQYYINYNEEINKKINTYENIQNDITNKLQQLQYYINYINEKINTYESIQNDITNKLQQLQYYINEEINNKINTYQNIQNNITNKLQNKFKLHELENNIKLNNYKNILQNQIIYYSIYFNNQINDLKNKHSSI
uniref:Uncharacterized protein n=1 Tax=viral metagenome TaxID=1070528 RepID=A0A6C0H871_9ZZZZ